MKKFFLLLVLTGCGVSSGDEPADPAPKPAPPPSGGGDELSFTTDVQPLLKTFCAQCHSDATFIATEEGFLGSKAPTRISNLSMPQKQSKNYAQWGNAQRQIIAEFVAQNQ